MFGFLKKKQPGVVVATLNARLQPVDRADLEDAFDDFMRHSKISAHVIGGGTAMAANGEVANCDIEIQLADVSEKSIKCVIDALNSMIAPKGSTLWIESKNQRLELGDKEGLAIYLNGTDLAEEIYRDCDINFVVSECERLLRGIAMVNSTWRGAAETALYIYGTDFETIRESIAPLLDSYPLCQNARIVRIA